ncbi:uncharacterized protein LOC114540395 [Dendronephthya gigantea]|uniref:uncharacterized protein LOC114540395 n=1 Tax=Dendronephthya gigantea TaxID=151771 RepID=UPI00106B785D|nr:uncharacterized protein LOC114540395 [Dendronephthya gigantea]
MIYTFCSRKNAQLYSICFSWRLSVRRGIKFDDKVGKALLSLHRRRLTAVNYSFLQEQDFLTAWRKDTMSTAVHLFILSLAFSAFSAQRTTTYTLKVTEDVTLERAGSNFNYLQFLLVGTHPGFPLKRSLMKFQNIPGQCIVPLEATLHLYFVYAHKASYLRQLPDVTRRIVAHTVLKSWSESQATSSRRKYFWNWDARWLNLGTDADPVTLSSTLVSANQGRQWFTLDVTKQVSDWKCSGSNHGLLLRDTRENIQGRDFRFASNAYRDQSKHAYITVKCMVK